MVRKPNRRGYARGCLLPDFLREDDSAMTVLGKHYAARQARHARADYCYTFCHTLMVLMGTKNTRSLES